MWDFITLIDMVTEEYVDEGERWGKVYGGKPITADLIADRLGEHSETTKKHLRRLEEHDYIRTRRTSRGLVIDVRRSIKWLMRQHGASGPSNQVIISELVRDYRNIPGVVTRSKDIAVIGKMCNEHGPDKVNYAVASLKQTMRLQAIDDPLAVMFSILKRLRKEPVPNDLDRVKAQRLAKADCPHCNGTGFKQWIYNGNTVPTQIPCSCWHHPTKT